MSVIITPKQKVLDALDQMVYIAIKRAALISGSSEKTVRRRVEEHKLRIVEINNKHFLIAKEFKKLIEEYPVGSYTHSPRQN